MDFPIPHIQVAVSICDKIYGSTGSYQSALAHQALAKTLMATQSFQEQEQEQEYHTQAVQAWRCAINCTEPNHPRLAQFKYTLGRS